MNTNIEASITVRGRTVTIYQLADGTFEATYNDLSETATTAQRAADSVIQRYLESGLGRTTVE